MKGIMNFKKVASVALIATFTLGAFSVYAQEDSSYLKEAYEVLNSEQIDIDGSFHARPQKSEADKQQEIRRNLEKDNENLVRKKIEDIRMKEEQKLTNQLKEAFNNGLGGINNQATNTDTVATQQASVQKVEQTLPVATATKSFSNEGKIKVIPNAGVVNIRTDASPDGSVESTFIGGLNIESMVSNRFAVGIGFSYMNLAGKDLDNQKNYYGNDYQFSNWYTNQYNQGREVAHNHLAVELNSKFFLAAESRVKPYVGMGIGYNRTTTKYKDQGQTNNYYNNYQNVQYGDEGFTSNYVSGIALLGSEVSLTEMVGLNVEVRYSRGLTKGYGVKRDAQSNQNYDQYRLEDIGSSLAGSDYLGATLGVIVAF